MATDDTNETAGGEWQSPYRMTPEAQAELLRALNIDAEKLPARVTSSGATLRVQRVAEGKIPPDRMAIALQLKGHLGAHVGGGKYNILCMTDGEHTNPDGTAENARGSCALLPPLEGKPYGLPFCQHAHCRDLTFDDWVAFVGAELWERAGEILDEMKTVGDRPEAEDDQAEAADPLEGLVARIAETKDTALAFAAPVLDAAATMKAEEPAAFQRLRKDLSAAGVSVSQWDADVHAVKQRRKQETKAAEQERAAAAAVSRRVAEAEARAKVAAKLAADAEAADPTLKPHHGDASTNDDTGIAYKMRPGRTWMERPAKRGEIEEVTLANFSAPIVANVLEIETPDAPPTMTRLLSVQIDGERALRSIAVPARDFDRMEWPGALLPERAVVTAGKGNRDHLRAALGMMSRAETRSCYRFTGWHLHDGQWLYLHAGGAIGAAGPVEGVRAEPWGEVLRYTFPPPGDDARRDVAALVELFAVEPARVVVPLLAGAFRSVMGPSRCTVFVVGRTELGKSLLVGLVTQCFGPTLSGGQPPLSFRRKGTTAQGILDVLAHIGDAPGFIDDFQNTPECMAMAEHVIPAHFNGASAVKRTRDGGRRHEPATRCGVLFCTAEVPPRGHSLKNRIVQVVIEQAVTPWLGEPDTDHPDGTNLIGRADEGQLARAMAAVVAWYAPRAGRNRPQLEAQERAAAKRWSLGLTNRAASLFGALALGLETFFEFLRDGQHVTAVALDAMRARAEKALRELASEHGEHVAVEDPARQVCEYLVTAIHGKVANVVAMLPNYRRGPPSDCESWGWKYVTRGNETTPEAQGKTVGYIPFGRQEIVIDPGVALEVVRDLARKDNRAIPLDLMSLPRALHDANLLARDSRHLKVPRYVVKLRLSAREERWWPALKFESLGFSSSVLPEDEDEESKRGNPPKNATPPATTEFPEVGPEETTPPFWED